MMKYKIGQNGGFIILLILVTISNCVQFSKSIKNLHELCSANRYIYDVGLDEHFELNLKSDPSNTSSNKWFQKSKRKCRKEFKSLPASHFFITISNMVVPSCSEECQCNYFEVSENGYKKKYCGEKNSVIYFESKTNYLCIDFQHSMHMTFEVTLNFTVERNTYIRTGPPSEGQFIESPYFPTGYPSDYTAEYILQNLDYEGYVLLLFLDFQMSQLSYIEVKGHNGSHVDRYFGNIFRPPAIISQGRELSLKFAANDQLSRPGFRAICLFERDFGSQIPEPPVVCGELKNDLGGVMDISTLEKENLFDCIWRIDKPLFETRSLILSTYIIDFKNIGRRASLEFHEGLNSKSKVVKSLNCNSVNCSLTIGSEVTVPASSGLYIRFNGYLSAQSSVKMSYSIYHTGNCTELEFSCENGRCIHLKLHCDGFDHCTDGSDEKQCSIAKATTQSSISTKQAPSHLYIHKEKLSASSASGFLVILMVGVIGITIVVLVVVIILFRQYKKRIRMHDQIPPHIAMTEVIGIPTRAFPFDTIECDLPPSYNDFIKSSDCYPPLLFTRAKRYAETSCNFPKVHDANVIHMPNSIKPESASIYTKEMPTKSNSGFDRHTKYTEVPVHCAEDCSSPSQRPCCSQNTSDTLRWTFKGTIDFKTHLRRHMSLDSNLDKAHGNHCIDCCHLHLSITDANCPRALKEQSSCCSKSLTSNFKISDLENVDISLESSTCGLAEASSSETHILDSSRRYTWSVITDCSISDSKVLALFKTRCHSEPYSSINLQCTLKRTPTI